MTRARSTSRRYMLIEADGAQHLNFTDKAQAIFNAKALGAVLVVSYLGRVDGRPVAPVIAWQADGVDATEHFARALGPAKRNA